MKQPKHDLKNEIRADDMSCFTITERSKSPAAPDEEEFTKRQRAKVKFALKKHEGALKLLSE